MGNDCFRIRMKDAFSNKNQQSQNRVNIIINQPHEGVELSYLTEMVGDDWEDIGRSSNSDAFLDSRRLRMNEDLIEKNASMLEGLLHDALYHDDAAAHRDDTDSSIDEHTILPENLRTQVRQYVALISCKYHHVGFHSFEHASHVMLSSTKLILMLKQKRTMSELRFITVNGTIHDPWLHFAIGLAALLHDVDHKGVPNQGLAAEHDPLSVRYGSRDCMSSYAEWNSLSMGLDILRSKDFEVFRKSIHDEERVFAMVEDLVLCTDIASKERRELGMAKWKTLFDAQDRRSTMSTIRTDNTSSISRMYSPEAGRIIAEQIIQASDVSHTMQHFDTFNKWNERLYCEVLSAYKSGRHPQGEETSDPAVEWYDSQISFYDFYVIPLAERLDASGVFYQENKQKFADLARQNKLRWSEEGRDLTMNMVKKVDQMKLPPPMPQTPNLDPKNSAGLLRSMLVDEKSSSESSADKTVDNTLDTLLSGSSSLLTTTNPNKWVTRDSTNVDISVNAIVPHVLAKQIISSLQRQIQSSSPETQANALEAAICRYHEKGSIQRLRGALLFIDISGFTNLSQNYPVEDFKTFINDYFTKIINLIESFDGQVVKFAGDALYALWPSKDPIDSSISGKHSFNDHALNIEKCTACAISISAECNNFKISKSYQRKSSGSTISDVYNFRAQGQGHALYSFQDKNAKYEEREAILNVYCGISEGIMAGVDVVAGMRSEFFLIGQPLKSVAIAEKLAGPGDLVVSPSVAQSLQKNEFIIASELFFENLEGSFCKVTWSHFSGSKAISALYREEIFSNNLNDTSALTVINDFVQSSHTMENMFEPKENTDEERHDQGEFGETINASRNKTLLRDILRLLEYHRHEAARDAVVKFSAELRRVVVIFINIFFEPILPEDTSEDFLILERFQCVFKVLSESISSRSGQVRQFINDDKGTVFIASFGLRGSVTLHHSATAIEAAKDAQQKLADMDIECSIGITLGKVFCGQTGSNQRYEYSLLGPPVNLSARLMAKGSAGQINCDEEIKQHNDGKHSFVINGTHKLKGYAKPVPFFTPLDKEHELKDISVDLDDPTVFFSRKEEIRGTVKKIHQWWDTDKGVKKFPTAVIVKGYAGTGKKEFISGVLNEASIRRTMIVLEGNRSYHDDPFYCWIPIILVILMDYEEIRIRLLKMKKKARRASLLASIYSHSAFELPALYRGVEIVPRDLKPYLDLVNDLIFKGFPMVKCSDAKRLKDDEKIKKCTEVLSAIVSKYVERSKRPVIINIPEINEVDEYSRGLIQHLSNKKCDLVFIGGVRKSKENYDGNEGVFPESLFDQTMLRDIEEINLEYLSKESTFELFSWSLKKIPDRDRQLLNSHDFIERVYEICGGMANVATELAHAFTTQWAKKGYEFSDSDRDKALNLKTLLDEIPTAVEDLVYFRFDHLNPDAQLLLKIASVAGFDQYSFSQNLLESIVLAFSRLTKENETGQSRPIDIVIEEKDDDFNHMFQDNYFEELLESLTEESFLDEVNVEMSDLSSLDSVMYRFRNKQEQIIINSLMLDDQKRRTHLEVAMYYSTSYNRGGEVSGENDEGSSAFSSSSEFTTIPTSNWQILHITALHYDLGNAPIPAMLHYYDSSSELAWLGIRDRSHGSLLSSYLMLEKLIHSVNFTEIAIDESMRQRQKVTKQMVEIIGGKEVKGTMQVLTQEHLRHMFTGDLEDFKKCIIMLTKFGQSVGTIEKEGYTFGAEIYLQAIQLLLLVLKDRAFINLTSKLGPFLGHDHVERIQTCASQGGENFTIDDLTISFPAFSGLLTFYRDSPIGANQEQETFLANLFVAVTQEANEVIHVLRTKCILSHLYLKHGDADNALGESEVVKHLYDHDAHSLELVNMYGMDWAIICVGTMTGEYIFRGELTAAFENIDFLNEQVKKLDEFASSTKAMMKGLISSLYLLLQDLKKAAEIVEGISHTQYSYFYKSCGVLQEGLAGKELAVFQGDDLIDDTGDFDLLAVLDSEDIHKINKDRPMINQSIETLSDRGMEAIRAAICQTEIRFLGRQTQNEEVMRRQLQYCQAAFVHLNRTLRQDDANNDERRRNYVSCLNQKAEILCQHLDIRQKLKENFNVDIQDALNLNGNELDSAISALQECEELCNTHGYPYILILIGINYIKLGIDETKGQNLIDDSLEYVKREKTMMDYQHTVECLDRMKKMIPEKQ